MNRNSIFLICFVLFLTQFSQTGFAKKKILFDNTKNQTAGNADWIIDDDQPIPSPVQAGITQATTEDYWQGALSSWGVEMVKRGYAVETLPANGSITYNSSSNSQDLSNYDIFVVCEPNNLFTSSEKKAMIDFVQDGGGLFIIADHAEADRDNDGWDALEVWNDFFSSYNNPFGFTFDAGSYMTLDPASNVADLPSNVLLHGPAGDVDGIATHGGATLTIDKSANSSVVGLVYVDGYSATGTTGVLAACATYGNGRVVGIGDSSTAEDETAHDYSTTYPGWSQPLDAGDATGDDAVFLTNATIWLGASANETELLTNPYFSAGTDGWWAYGADISTNQGEVTFDISNAGVNPWDISLGQGNITLKQGYTYTLCWRAKRESGGLSIAVGLGAEPWTLFIADSPSDFDNNWQEHCIEYTHNNEEVSNVSISVNMGGSDADVVFDYISLKEELKPEPQDEDSEKYIGQSYTHPGSMELSEVPQFVCLSFDDNLAADGVEWLCEQTENLKNPNMVDVGLSFFFNSQFLSGNEPLINVVNTYMAGDESPNEIGNHTYDHPHLEEGRTIEEWKTIVQQGIDGIANPTNITAVDLLGAGFRAPYLETSEEMYAALNEMGVRYDHSATTYYNEANEAGWPYMVQSETMDGTGKFLWKVPISELFVPETAQELTAYGIDQDIATQVGGNKVGAGDYELFEVLKLNSTSILGLLKYNLDRSLASNKAPFTFCFHSQYYSEDWADGIAQNSNTTLQERKNLLSSFIAYCQQNDEVYLTTIGQLLDWMEAPVSPDILYKNPGAGPVSFYGEMQVNGNRIYGERTGTPVQVKGMSLYWSIWGGEKFWNSGAVNALVDDWDIELIRAPMSVENNQDWDYGYIHPNGREKQLAFVDEIVQTAIARDIYVLIDYHSHYADEHPEAAVEFFSTVAQKYGQYDNVIFEIYNEPAEAPWSDVKAYAEEVIPAIRQYSDNLIVVGTEFWSMKPGIASLSPLDDENTAYVIHFYAGYDQISPSVIEALDNGVALFASEWGTIMGDGEYAGHNNETSFEITNTWHKLLDENYISSANWCVAVENFRTGAALFYDEEGYNGDVSFTGESWDDETKWSDSGHYMHELFQTQSANVLWRKAERQGYSITYYLNGGYNGANPYFYKFSLEDDIELKDPIREGYQFEGWYTSSSFSGASVTQINVGSSGEMELFAKWSELTEIELLNCPHFELGNYGWNRWGDNNSTSVETSQLIIHEPTDNSANIWDYSFFNNNQFELKKGHQYTLSWKAKRAAGKINFEIRRGDPYTVFFSDEADFNGQWQENTIVYEHTGETVSGIELYVNVGGNSSDVTFDRVSFKELIPQETTGYVISTAVAPSGAGTVTGAGTYQEGESVTLTATTNDGYEFVNWTKGGSIVSTNSAYTFSASENASYTANFEAVAANVVLRHCYPFEDGTAKDIIAGADGVLHGGTISGGIYKATANGNVIELPAADIAINSYTEITLEAYITADADNAGATMLAYFGGNENGVGGNGFFITPDRWTQSRAAISCGNLTEPWNAESGVTGTQVSVGEKHHLVVTLNTSNIAFYIDGALVGTSSLSANNKISNISNVNAWLCKGGYDNDPSWLGSIDEFNIYEGLLSPGTIAEHASTWPVYTISTFAITTNIHPQNSGTVTGAGTYEEGALVTLRATANDGYEFVNWTKGGTTVSSQSTFTFTATEDALYTANFEAIQNILSIAEVQGSTDVSPYVGKVVEIQGEVTHTTQAGCYIQDANAIRSGIYIYNNEFRDLTVGTGLKVKGTVFEYNGMTELENIVSWETFSSNLAITPFELPQAAIAEDFEGMLVGTSEVKVVDVDFSENWFSLYLAEFQNEIEFVVSNVYSSYDLNIGSTYKLIGIVEYNNNLFKLCPRTANDIEQLETATYTITCTVNPAEAGTVTGAGTYDEGESITLTATASEGFEFINWTKAGNVISTNSSYSFTATEDAAYTANFEETVGQTIAVTFQVDMKKETIDASGVYLNGDFCQNWTNPIKLDPNGTIYQTTVELVPEMGIEYKFMNGAVYENFSGDCTGGDNNNRQINLPDESLVLDVVCFNSCESCPTAVMEFDNMKVTVYPNPFENHLFLDGLDPEEAYNIQLIGVTGQCYYEERLTGASTLTISLKAIPVGIYNLSMECGGQQKNVKLTKN